MNQVHLLGRMAYDPVVKNTGSTTVAHFTVAVERTSDHNILYDHISCTAFGKTADLIEKYFQRGKPISISGRIQSGSYEENGKRIFTTEVIAERVEFVPQAAAGNAKVQKKSEGRNRSNGWGIDFAMDDLLF